MTTDERLAALEAKMDALTAPPSDYYTSRYSGEEIDAAIAAVPGKAETAQLCNRNLLDNWYFGNPVDQRGGYISLQGVPVYNDAACTSLMGNQTETAATCIKSDTNYQRIINGQGSGYVKAADVVRGYVGVGYGIDRWKALTDVVTLTISNDGITLHRNGGNPWLWSEQIESSVVTNFMGKHFTVSVLTTQGLVVLDVPSAFTSETSITDPTGVSVWLNTSGIVLIGTINDSMILIAAKLELGSQQTLAHQDADGNWVLNEVPDYGEQLRRCQRYFEKTSWNVCIAVATTTTTIDFCGSYYFKVEKRVLPVINVSTPAQVATIYDTVANVYYTVVEVQQPTASNTKMMAPRIYDSKGRFVIGRIYQVIVGDGQYLVSADL